MKNSLFPILLFTGLVSFAAANKAFLDSLQSSFEKTKSLLSKEQQEDMNNIRTRLTLDKKYDSGNLLFDTRVNLGPETSAFLDEKEALSDQEVMLSNRGYGLYKKYFDQYIADPCEKIKEIWMPTLSAYYLSGPKVGLLAELKEQDVEKFNWMINSAFCFAIAEKPYMSCTDSYASFVGKTIRQSIKV